MVPAGPGRAQGPQNNVLGAPREAPLRPPAPARGDPAGSESPSMGSISPGPLFRTEFTSVDTGYVVRWTEAAGVIRPCSASALVAVGSSQSAHRAGSITIGIRSWMRPAPSSGRPDHHRPPVVGSADLGLGPGSCGCPRPQPGIGIIVGPVLVAPQLVEA